MTKTEKALQKHKMRKMVEEVLKSPEYKEKQQQMESEWVTKALARFAFIMCGFLETRHGYKKDGLNRFLSFLLLNLDCTQDDENFFVEYDKYYKSEYGLDVLAALGMELEGKEQCG